jgi:hypothetical protein
MHEASSNEYIGSAQLLHRLLIMHWGNLFNWGNQRLHGLPIRDVQILSQSAWDPDLFLLSKVSTFIRKWAGLDGESDEHRYEG